MPRFAAPALYRGPVARAGCALRLIRVRVAKHPQGDACDAVSVSIVANELALTVVLYGVFLRPLVRWQLIELSDQLLRVSQEIAVVEGRKDPRAVQASAVGPRHFGFHELTVAVGFYMIVEIGRCIHDHAAADLRARA